MLLETDDFLTISEIAKLRTSSRQAIYQFLAKPDAPAPVLIGGTSYFLKQDLERFPKGRAKRAH